MIHHVQLACPPGSEAALRAFYHGVLGLEEIPKPPALAARGGCWFRGHGIELHLGVEEGFRPARKAHPGLRPDQQTHAPIITRCEVCAGGLARAADRSAPGTAACSKGRRGYRSINLVS